jgi:UDP-N-acetylmuramoyl-tripeptide--D-alanyl-D-alanine ligase
VKTEELYQLFTRYRSISTDSRKLSPGSIFFALKGENFNGNRFALQAIEQGCSYAVVDDPSLPVNKQLIYFPDVLDALQKLAKTHRNQLKIPFIGITGSNGKTTTKELMTAVLSSRYKVCSTHGNLNNHIGVPLTILSVHDHDIAIIEMGANHIGEIDALCKIADPDFGIITNIGKAHLEGFGSPEGVIKAKSELYDHLAQRKAKVFVDAGNPLLTNLATEKNLDVVYYGNSPKSVCSGEITRNNWFLNIKIQFSSLPVELSIESKMVGDYNLNNLLAAACIGHFFGVTPKQITNALSEYVPSNSRSQLMITPNNKIVLDAYNANPSSMEGSIKNFLSLSEEWPKMIILGDMLELGKYSRSEHIGIIDFLVSRGLSEIFLVGPEFCAVSDPSTFHCYRKVEDLIEHFRSNPVKERCILLKGSRGIKLEKLLEIL